MTTTLDVQKILRQNILAGLAAYGYGDGFEVIEFANFGKIRKDKVVTMNLLRRKRVGWQGRKYSSPADELTRTDEWISEEHWQLQVILKRNSGTKDDSILSQDIAEVLVTWFNGLGCDEFRKYGIANLRIDSEQIIVYNDDSDLYQKRCVFTVKIQVPKELTVKQPEMATELEGIYGV